MVELIYKCKRCGEVYSLQYHEELPSKIDKKDQIHRCRSIIHPEANSNTYGRAEYIGFNTLPDKGIEIKEKEGDMRGIF